MNPDALRIGAVVVAVIALILLVTRFRLHPFVTLIVVSIFLGLACGLPPVEVIKHFEKGFGDVLSFVGIVIGLGTMLGGMLVFSGVPSALPPGWFPLEAKNLFHGRSFSPRC
jgi:gluconate:H+ symporter, GntP family